MFPNRRIFSAVATGGFVAGIALLTGSPAASGDELADLRANQELLQKRIDQLSQAPPQAAPQAAPFVPGFGPETLSKPTGIPAVGGSFPRSFLIPGTDTSLRIGGFANAVVQWYASGANQGGSLAEQGGINNNTFFDGPGGTGNLPNIPLNNSISRSRSNAFDISPRTSRVLFDARTPTAWGQIRAYLEWDFAYNNTNVIQSNNQGTAMSEFARLRKAYGTFGGFQAGLDTGLLHDGDADPELIDGDATKNGRLRTTSVKYTYAGPYGTVFTAGGEQPDATIDTIFGKNDIDTQEITGISPCSVTGNTVGVTTAVGSGTVNLPVTTACVRSFAFFDTLQATMPEFPVTARVNQPWGHLQIGGVLRNQVMNDGQYLFRQNIGYAGSISGDVHPFTGAPGALGKDDLGYFFGAGSNTGNQIENGVGTVTDFGKAIIVPGVGPGGTPGLVNPLAQTAGTAPGTTAAWNARDTNQGALGCATPNSGACINGINVRQAYDRLVRVQPASSYGAFIWYQHWWTENLRSTIEASGFWAAINTSILGPGTTNNKLLGMAHANLFWSPVAFVDFGVEYAWGHRVTVANFKGDSNTLLGEMRVRF